jgi:hypothetical protein
MKTDIHFWSYLTKLLLSTRNVSHKSCTENQNTRVMFNVFFENRAVLWDNVENVVKPDRPQMTTRRLRIACSIPKATRRHSEYVILIAFTATMAARTRLNVTLLCTLPVLFSAKSTWRHVPTERHFVCIHHQSHYHSECHKSSTVERLITKLDNREFYEHLSTDYHFRLHRTIFITTTWGSTSVSALLAKR